MEGELLYGQVSEDDCVQYVVCCPAPLPLGALAAHTSAHSLPATHTHTRTLAHTHTATHSHTLSHTHTHKLSQVWPTALGPRTPAARAALDAALTAGDTSSPLLKAAGKELSVFDQPDLVLKLRLPRAVLLNRTEGATRGDTMELVPMPVPNHVSVCSAMLYYRYP